ncbi:MAG: hypothetical protein E7599_01245 [Ruminococcaceae bacterium]|nr:hypothetical protein [Oscillospiraceae bacterium]
MKEQHNQIEEKLKSAFESATPNLVDSILAECENKKGRILAMTNEKRFSRFTKWAAATAACLVMIVGCVAGYAAFIGNTPTPAPTPAPTQPTTPVTPDTTVSPTYDTVAATVTLDVNPSLEIKVDENEKVLEVIALNEDAKQIIGNMDFQNSSLEVTVNALIGSMLQNGYINQTTNSVLLSVDSTDESTGNAIKDKLSAEISTLIHTETIQGSVISQIVNSKDEELIALATEYGISIGKAKLIQTIIKVTPNKEFSHYAKLSITELHNIMNASATQPDDESIYIGEEKALEIALSRFHLTKENLYNEPIINLVSSRGDICYQIHFRVVHNSGSSTSYVTYINAITGKHPGDDITEPNFTMEEAWSFVCEKLGDDAQNANILMKQFNDMESGLPMTYSFYFEIGTNEYSALVDAMNGMVIRVVEA